MAAFSTNKTIEAVSIAQNASGSFPMDIANMKSVAVQFSKTGTGSGTAKLQWTIDGTIWTDVNTTQNPEASAAVAAGPQSVALSASDVPGGLVRVIFTEGNVGAVSITGGKWLAKLY